MRLVIHKKQKEKHKKCGLNKVKTTLCFRYEGETGEEHNLVIFKDTALNNHINGELSTRPFH